MSIVESSVPADLEDPILPVEEVDPELEPDQPDPEAEIEARARAMGWHPLDEFRGPKERWVDAAQFIARGETELPILREQNRRLLDKTVRTDAEVAAMRSTIAEQTEALKELRDLARRANDQGYQRALRELKDKRREAVQTGDQAEFDRLEEQIDALQEERSQVVPPKPAESLPAAAVPPKDPAIEAFERANASWWNRDGFLSGQMVAFHSAVMREHPDWSLGDQLDQALADLKQRFPESFPDEVMTPRAAPAPAPQPRPRAAPVAAPRAAGPQPQRKTGFERIEDPTDRQEAMQAYERIKRQQPDITVAEYLSIYLDPHADVIELQRNARKRA